MRIINVVLLSLIICFGSFCQSQIITDTSKAAVRVAYTKENNLQHIVPDLKLYPNPAENKVMLQVKNFDVGMVSVKVLDSKGKQMREDNRLLTTGTEDIIMFLMLKSGIYFIVVSAPGKSAKKKLVIF